MVKKMKQGQKRKLTILLAVLLVAVLSVGGTYMYMTATTGAKTNPFNLGTTTPSISEPGVNPNSATWGANAKPVTVTNTGTATGVVRVMLLPTLTDKTTGNALGTATATMTAPSGNAIAWGDITLNLDPSWSSNWTYGSDGFFYYKHTVAPGATTNKLLAGVTLATGKASDYANIVVNVSVKADIIQSGGTAPAEWGCTVDTGGNVTKS